MMPEPSENLDPIEPKPDTTTQPDDGDDFAELGGLLTPKGVPATGGFQSLAGNPGVVVKGDRFVCPVPGCSVDWYRTRVGQSPPLCEAHGLVLVPEASQP
ncbi:MAG: hypothetical protein ACFB0C_02640 [Leptolyngbyaceae cyanobacterium]